MGDLVGSHQFKYYLYMFTFVVLVDVHKIQIFGFFQIILFFGFPDFF
jgi:hypothetical protein